MKQTQFGDKNLACPGCGERVFTPTLGNDGESCLHCGERIQWSQPERRWIRREH